MKNFSEDHLDKNEFKKDLKAVEDNLTNQIYTAMNATGAAFVDFHERVRKQIRELKFAAIALTIITLSSLACNAFIIYYLLTRG